MKIGEEVERILPDDTAINAKDLVYGPRSRRFLMQSMFNYEQFGLETEKIREELESDIVSYISRKRLVEGNRDKLKLLLKARSYRSTDLVEFLKTL